jgi:transcriptional regulator GlxA family with amidase domain
MIQVKMKRDGERGSQMRINWDAFQSYLPLKKVLSQWSENRGVPISVPEAAKVAAMTPAYFSRFFHHKVGVTFKYWIDFMRVRYAASLLSFADITVIELGEQCGFRDATTFTRTFRRILGLTPLQYKLRQRSQTPTHDARMSSAANLIAGKFGWRRG